MASASSMRFASLVHVYPTQYMFLVDNGDHKPVHIQTGDTFFSILGRFKTMGDIELERQFLLND